METDVAVIGAGVVGLAVAAELAGDASVAVLERHEGFGRENSSHNSGVIHAGIYFPPGWLKTTLCLVGNRLLYEWCREHGVRARRTGKLIVAADEAELPDLDRLMVSANENGVPELQRLSEREVRSVEPAVRSAAAIYSGSSGVVDQMGLMQSLLRSARSSGAHFAVRHEVSAIERCKGGFLVKGRGPAGRSFDLAAARVVNCAGLAADRIGRLLGYDPEGGARNPPFRQFVNRGSYYDVTGAIAREVGHLIYPVPTPDREGLGVHLTVDIDGGVHLGPDSEWLDETEPLDFRSRDDRRQAFLDSARRYLPELGEDDLAPGQVGYRPKLQRPGGEPRDFLVWEDRGYVHLGGIESPGLTASLALARHVRAVIKGTAG